MRTPGSRDGSSKHGRLAWLVVWSAIGCLLLAAVARAQDDAPTKSTDADPPPAAETDVPKAGGPAAEIAKELEGTLAKLKTLEAEWQARQDAVSEDTREAVQAEVLLEAELVGAKPGSEDVERVFARISKQLRAAIVATGKAMDRTARDAAPDFIDPDEWDDAFPRRFHGGDTEIDTESSHLRSLLDRLEEREDEFGALEDQLEGQSVARHWRLTRELYQLRLAALDALPKEARDRIVSFSPEGQREIELELALLVQMARADRMALIQVFSEGPELLRDLFAAVNFGRLALRLLLVLLGVVVLRRTLRTWAQRRREHAKVMVDPRRRRSGLLAADVADAIWPWVLLLGATYGIDWALSGHMDAMLALDELLLVLRVYATYRLATGTIGAVLRGGLALRLGVGATDEPQGLRGSIRWPLRIVALWVLLAGLCELRLGQGVAYEALTLAGTWFVGSTLLLSLVLRREDITDAYLGLERTGRRPALVRRARGTWKGIATLPLTAIWLLIGTVACLGRDLLLGAEQVDRVNAYFFRRRVEREALRHGHASGVIRALPDLLLQAVEEQVTAEDCQACEREDGLDRAREAVADWRAGDEICSFMVAAEEGIGKRAWIDRFAREQESVDRVCFAARKESGAEVVASIGNQLCGDRDGDWDHASLAAELNSGARRVVVIEAVHHLFLSALGGYAPLEALHDLADATRNRVFWVLTIGRSAWRHLSTANRELRLMRHVAELPSWNEEQIRMLVHRRIASSGVRVTFADLVEDAGEGEDPEAIEDEGERAFAAVLWDFTDGNPRVALHYLKRSIVAGEDGEFRVRLFKVPPAELLLELGDEALFLLASLIRHETLTIEQAAEAMGFSTILVRSLSARLVDIGVLHEVDGIYTIVSRWKSTVVRVARRRNVMG
jgi:hypothetical protein